MPEQHQVAKDKPQYQSNDKNNVSDSHGKPPNPDMWVFKLAVPKLV
ncbi:hypothetical protein AALB_3957 [Agarivorans albus MKT 106]|uniref:Uncharacterized protein n=1 Tax=Agarivorans albus MKT 106 TaxID=1331007 RepID=R9PR67_AGAAL|nr:hypothetical protein AALB_3957 [Agarivorans albus MKT 106]